MCGTDLYNKIITQARHTTRLRHYHLVMSMLFRFGVILTPESSDEEVFVLGSCAEMGQWDPSRAVQMKASQKLPSPQEPCLWTGHVQLTEPLNTLWFKFIKRVRGTYIWEGIHEHCHHIQLCKQERVRRRVDLTGFSSFPIVCNIKCPRRK